MLKLHCCNLSLISRVEFGHLYSRCFRKLRICSISTSARMPRFSNSFEGSIEVKFSRSSGPGGQNVNKLTTKAEVRLNLAKADWMLPGIKETLIDQQKNRITKRGELIVTSELSRSQSKNLKDAIQKLKSMIDKASLISNGPSKEKMDKILQYVEKENEKRLLEKKYHAEKKKHRTEL